MAYGLKACSCDPLTKIWIGDLLTKKIQNDAVIEP